jgi:flagellar L-ring protein precursor FlgH
LPLYCLAGVLLFAPGCMGIKKIHEPNPMPHAQLPTTPQANPDMSQFKRADGSIYNSRPTNLFADDKGLRQGDIVLVRVKQKNTGSKAGNTETKRESSISAKIKYLFGLEDDVNDLTGYTNVTKNADGTKTVGEWDPNNMLEASSSSSFKGDATTKRTDSLEATVSAIVTEVLSNGNLVIYGHQTVALNNESSVLTVQGIVRPSDLEDDNSVDSSRIANANIEFTGSGVITDKQHPGWGSRIFDWVWPF